MSTSSKSHDVFLSFRGEDTRANFAINLYHTLCKKNIQTYIDYNIEKGDDVWPALAKAIQDSDISVIVFSENYASSKWCLDELLEILKCRKNHRQVVIPVFYKTDPSDIRHQRGSYKKAFAKYKRELKNNKNYEDKVSKWRDALTEAADLCGWDSGKFRDDYELIENIVKDVWQKQSLKYPHELKGLVEIDKNRKDIESFLNEFPRIGIWGMGGQGKTTIAREMFAKYFAQYDSVCFLEKVREESEKFGLTSVRNKLFSELLKEQIATSDAFGHTFIQRRLGSKKVFIVLDDVKNATQVEYLFEELGDLGPGSKLIITTRDRHALSTRVDKIYNVTKWEFPESLELFSLRAFQQTHPKEGYERLSERAVAYAGGVPLALKVLGLHLRGRNAEFWKSQLDYLENKEEFLDEIQKVLQVSYNGLSQGERDIFLDIAFFFKGEDKNFATRILNACNFNATCGIEILEDKALITISKSNRIQMHDLIQKMALHIVGEKPSLPGKRSRLRDIEEVRDVLENSKGTDEVKGIALDLSQIVDLQLQADTFSVMTDLRFLRLYVPLGEKRSGTVHYPTVLMPFPKNLRYLEWNGYPFESLPSSFCANLLVEIRLQHSNVKYIWHGIQELVNLEGIDLSECKQLIKLPDLSKASKLKWLYLSGCEDLCDVEPHVFKDTLVTLLLDRCKKLKRLTSEKHLRSLQNINVNGCSSLKEFSLFADSIERLDLNDTGIETLNLSVDSQSRLDWLNLEGLRLKNLPNELSCLRSLTKLWISNCTTVTEQKLRVLFDGLESLQILHLKDCGNLSELPDNISSLESLYELRLDGSRVEKLPTSIQYLSKLEILSLQNCKELSHLPKLTQQIKEFHADNCTSLVTVSTLETFSVMMNGKEKHISFKNDIKLDGASLHCIKKDALLTMKSAAFHNILVRKYSARTHSYNYNSAEVCLPGSRVPRQFRYRTTDSSITVDISYTLGFIFSVVVSPSRVMNEHGDGPKIQCQCYSKDGREVGYASIWHHKTTTDLNSDHVYVWYDPYHSDSILGDVETNVSFEFRVTTNEGERDGLFTMKECGVCPIYFSEFPRFLGTMNLDKDLELELIEELSKELGPDLDEAMQFESETIESSDEGEGNAIESIGRGDENISNDVEAIEISDEKEDNGIESVERSDDKEDKGCKSNDIERSNENEGNGKESLKRSDEKEDNDRQSITRSNERESNGFKSKLRSWLRSVQLRLLRLWRCELGQRKNV